MLGQQLARTTPNGKACYAKTNGSRFVNFTTRWGFMHPQEAIERYEQ